MSKLLTPESREDAPIWGRLVENAVGAHLLNRMFPPRFGVGYWRECNFEVDYVATAGRGRVGIEVKSGRPGRIEGLSDFRKRFPSARVLLLGRDGIPLEDAFREDPQRLLGFE